MSKKTLMGKPATSRPKPWSSPASAVLPSFKGCPGAYENVWRIVQYLKKREQVGEPLPDALPRLRATQAKGILIARPEKRTEQEGLALERTKGCDRTIGKCCLLFKRREEHTDAAEQERARASIREWIEDAKRSEIPEL